MFGRLFILLAILAIVLYGIYLFQKTPPQKVARFLRKATLYAVITLVVILAATGRLNWLFAVIGVAIPFIMRAVNLLRMVPMIKQLLASLGLSGPTSAASADSRQTSSIRTRFIDMVLDHGSGELDGTILEGNYRGRRLSELDLESLFALLADCRTRDEQSAAVLEAYLDRSYDGWRERVGSGEEQVHRAASVSGEMTPEEAWAVLGLEPGADTKEIRAAHRRLMQKFHPDRGGSTYLAAKINQAKDLLMEGN